MLGNKLTKEDLTMPPLEARKSRVRIPEDTIKMDNGPATEDRPGNVVFILKITNKARSAIPKDAKGQSSLSAVGIV